MQPASTCGAAEAPAALRMAIARTVNCMIVDRVIGFREVLSVVYCVVVIVDVD